MSASLVTRSTARVVVVGLPSGAVTGVMMGTMNFERLDACFGAKMSGIRVTDLDDAQFAELYAKWLEVGLLVFEGQELTREEQIAFAKRFGPLEIEIAELSNVMPDGSLRPDDGTDDMMKVHRGNMGWHHDSTYMPVQAKGAVFCAEVVPAEGGATGFADMAAAYDALDDETRAEIADLRAHHSLYHSQAKVGHHSAPVANASATVDGDEESTYGGYGFHDGPVSVRPLVKEHPETGRKNLLAGRHAYDVVGLSAEESEALLTRLNDHAADNPTWIYHHAWAPGDAVLWDNRRLMHQATPWPFDQVRIMWHSRIAGDPESEAALTE